MRVCLAQIKWYRVNYVEIKKITFKTFYQPTFEQFLKRQQKFSSMKNAHITFFNAWNLTSI